ncbi:initiator tRNA phosphoribosyl transferase [Rickenella mellea]|uniref:Initiator tRNA phosphoribosyl transferase n=1 Tax=Rickenella mellea TaxID=50990 RepID=A0A4Y7Q6B7_9AGAM|nr:initiator tRNA phosphoribosyl transferase [Rickenella mellea]
MARQDTFDAHFVDRQREEKLVRQEIRREYHDTYNRIHSIAEDAEFVSRVRQAYSSYPMIANLRCGSWYTDPSTAHPDPAYFKSTDGHFGNWDFNLRRPNLHLLPLINEHQCIFIVDSTRAGKTIPDALSKTVPIWCAVINRTMGKRQEENWDAPSWDIPLYTPSHLVSEQEHAQISEKLDTWADSLLASSYEIPTLDLPLRPFWLTPSIRTFPAVEPIMGYYPVVCVSASKLVAEGMERRQGGFVYVQGSGDDHESWSLGLTPELFWRHKDEILGASRSELPGSIARIIARAPPGDNSQGDEWINPPTPVNRISGLISLSSIADLPNSIRNPGKATQSCDLQLPCLILRSPTTTITTPDSESTEDPYILSIEVTPMKNGGGIQFMTEALPRSMKFIQSHLYAGRSVHIACDTGKDISVGIAVAALQHYFDDGGKLVDPNDLIDERLVDKNSIRTRLQWIIASRPQANPSRATLKRVNEYFLSSPSFRKAASSSKPSQLADEPV